MGATRIKGTNVLLSLAGTDYGPDLSKAILLPEDAASDVTTFEDAQAGGSADWFLDLTSIQSTVPTALWRYLWENSGDEGIAYVFGPHGNAVASADKPHFTGTVTLPRKPQIGGEAGRDNTYTFDVRLQTGEEPTLDEGA